MRAAVENTIHGSYVQDYLEGSDEMDPVTGDQGLERNPLVLIFRIHKSRGKNAITLAKVIGHID